MFVVFGLVFLLQPFNLLFQFLSHKALDVLRMIILKHSSKGRLTTKRAMSVYQDIHPNSQILLRNNHVEPAPWTWSTPHLTPSSSLSIVKQQADHHERIHNRSLIDCLGHNGPLQTAAVCGKLSQFCNFSWAWISVLFWNGGLCIVLQCRMNWRWVKSSLNVNG